MLCNENVKIEYLPTIGEAISIKTRKQGRRCNLSEVENDALDFCTSQPNQNTVKKRHKRYTGLKLTLRNAKRVINFEKSTEKQKNICKEFIETEDFKLGKIVNGINKYLSNRYKNY